MAQALKKPEEVERVTPTRAMSPWDEMERAFEDFFPRGWMRRRAWPSWGELTRTAESGPRVDVIDRDDEILVRAELPGVEKKDLDVSLTENTVTIKGSKRREEKEEKGDYFRSEIVQGEFLRTVSLPNMVDTDKAEASFKDGVLELKVAKVSKAKRRSIKVD